MSVPITLNGIPYLIPSNGETGWGTEVSSYLIALSTGVLSLNGGNFTLTNEVNFGSNYGLNAPYFKSGEANAADSGVLRLTNTEYLAWRNSTNTADLALYLVGDQLYFAGSPVGGGSVSPLTTKGDIYTYSTTNARLPVGLNGQALIADSSSPTGLAWAAVGGGGGGTVVGFNFTNANGIVGSVADPTTTPNLTLSLGDITPNSVSATGAVTGSNLSGTHTGTSSGSNTGDQTITLTGDVTGSGTGSFATTLATVGIAKGGTGQTTANAAFNALAPTQTGHAGEVLITDGSNTSWASFPGAGSVTSVAVTPSQGVIASVANSTTTPNISIGLGLITPTSVAATGTVTGSNISGSVSGTNTGDQTISLTGDVTGTGTGSFATTLANTLVTPGSYSLTSLTVDAKGRITSASNGSAVTTVSVVTANGVSGSVANATTTPAITLALGNITPTSITNTLVGALSEQYSTSVSVNAALYNVSKFTLASNTTITTPTSIPANAYTVTYFITQAAGSYTVTWFSGIKWKDGTIPTMSTVNGQTDIYILTTFDSGTTWFGTASKGYV